MKRRAGAEHTASRGTTRRTRWERCIFLSPELRGRGRYGSREENKSERTEESCEVHIGSRGERAATRAKVWYAGRVAEPFATGSIGEDA